MSVHSCGPKCTRPLCVANRRIAELESQNTFWACKKHTQQNTLRCAICDEQHIKELQAKVDELTVEKENIHTNLTNEALRLVDVCEERQATITELRAKVEEQIDQIEGATAAIDRSNAREKALLAKVEELTDALEQASLNFNRSTKYGKGWHDALAYVNRAALKQEGEE